MQAVRSAGLRPVLRATGAGVASALLALLVFLRGMVEVIDPVTADVAQVGAVSLIVFAAAALGGATGAWQAAVAGFRTRRTSSWSAPSAPEWRVPPPASCSRSGSPSIPGRALLEPVMVAVGAGTGAWGLAAVALLLARLRGVAGPELRRVRRCAPARRRHRRRAAGVGGAGADRRRDVERRQGDRRGRRGDGAGGRRRPGPGAPVADPTGDSDGDGLNNEEEAALGTDPDAATPTPTACPTIDEFTHGTDPLQGVEPLTEENLARPWERIGISEDEWKLLEESVLDEINPGGMEELRVRRRGRQHHARRERRARARPARRDAVPTRTAS